MATDKAVSATPIEDRSLSMSLIERLHVQRGMSLYLKSLERSRNNELAGSDIYRLRTADMVIVRDILNRVS